MLLKRTAAWMAVLAGAFLMAMPAYSQGLQDLQVFAPAEVSTYGGGVRPKEGFFFSFDLLYWSFSAPDGNQIGFPSEGRQVFYGPNLENMAIQTNTIDTSIFTQDWDGGERFEIGDRWRHHGWMVGTLRTNTHGQEIAASNVSMVWRDPTFGEDSRRLIQGYYLVDVADPPTDVPPSDFILVDGELAVIRDLPVTFDDFTVDAKTQIWGVEAMYSYRTHPGNHGGFFELYLGGRYMELNDYFAVNATNGGGGDDGGDDGDDGGDGGDGGDGDDDTTVFGPAASLADSNWATDAENHLVGPQIALRWFRTSDRWTFDTSGRFFAGFNNQNFNQVGTIGSRLTPGTDSGEGRPLVMSPTSFTHGAHRNEWSPVVEFRANLQYQLTRGISIRGGWTGMWIDGIARASNVNQYEVPDMGFNLTHNREDVFIHGFNGGILWNY